ncbi:MAG TPA: hypothetical protein V6C95_12375, partial [Coleofasciculaceae cyanobacterium]
MDAKLTATELEYYRELLEDEESVQTGLDMLEECDGRINRAFDELLKDMIPPLKNQKERRNFRQMILNQLRQEVCDSDYFPTTVQNYSKNPGSASLLMGLMSDVIGSIGTEGILIGPSLAIVITLYILKIGLNTFCEYTESSATD